MTNRKKRLAKAIDSLEKRRQEHLRKLEEERGKETGMNYTLVDYWEKEVEGIMTEKKKKEELLKKSK